MVVLFTKLFSLNRAFKQTTLYEIFIAELYLYNNIQPKKYCIFIQVNKLKFIEKLECLVKIK